MSKDTVLMFCNKRSGGNKGALVFEKYQKLIEADKIYDLSDRARPPHLILKEWVGKGGTKRVIVCGGDGTMGWLLSAIDELHAPADEFLIAMMPLGTGNDLARSFNWGAGFTSSMLKQGFLKKVLKAGTGKLDRWMLTILPENQDPAEHAHLPHVMQQVKQDPVNTEKVVPEVATPRINQDQHSTNTDIPTQPNRKSKSGEERVMFQHITFSSEEVKDEYDNEDGVASGAVVEGLPPAPVRVFNEEEEEEEDGGTFKIMNDQERDSGSVKRWCGLECLFVPTSPMKNEKRNGTGGNHLVSTNATYYSSTGARTLDSYEPTINTEHDMNDALGDFEDVHNYDGAEVEPEPIKVAEEPPSKEQEAPVQIPEREAPVQIPAKPTPPEPLAFKGPFCNYFSIGVDAIATYAFHATREAKPHLFKSQAVNKLRYVQFGMPAAGGCMCYGPPPPPPISSFCTISYKGQNDTEFKALQIKPKFKGIICLNLQSYAGGQNFWGSQGSKRFNKPASGDGMFEIVGITGIMDVGKVIVLNKLRAKAKRLAQCKELKITMKSLRHQNGIGMQIDGEPWISQPCTLHITHLSTATVLTNQK